MKDILPKILLIQYLLIALVYGFNKDWARVGYWLGAFIIVISTLMMKG